MIRWEAPGPVRRRVHDARRRRQRRGRSTSLNLGSRGDDPERDRREPPPRLRGARARRRRGSRSTASGTRRPSTAPAPVRADEAGRRRSGRTSPACRCSRSSADCVPIAIVADRRAARAGGRARRLARPRRRRRRGRRRGARTRGETAAVVGPAIGPCCYEVGPEVSARFDADLTTRRHPRPLDGRRARAPPRGRRDASSARPLHALQPGAVLLAPPQRRAARRAGRDRCCRRLRFAPATSGCARRSGRA